MCRETAETATQHSVIIVTEHISVPSSFSNKTELCEAAGSSAQDHIFWLPVLQAWDEVYPRACEWKGYMPLIGSTTKRISLSPLLPNKKMDVMAGAGAVVLDLDMEGTW